MLEEIGGYLVSFSVSQHSAEGQFYMDRGLLHCIKIDIILSLHDIVCMHNNIIIGSHAGQD